MRIKVLIPNADGTPGGSLTLQEIDQEPKVGDILLYEYGGAVLLTHVTPAGQDPDGADFVCRAADGTGKVLKGRDVTF